MGVYSLDRSSPKKALPRSGFLEVKRKLSNRRYLCLWVFVALVPCYLLRQMFFSQSTSRATFLRDPVEERLATTATEKTAVSYEMPPEPKKKESVLDRIFNRNTIKPAKYTTVINPATKKVENVTRNSMNLKLKENFEDDDEDFGSAEDNDKLEEQMWTAPPTPALPKE